MPVFTSSIEVTADYPTIKPSLNLNFARSRSLDSRITFTRASVGTYVGRDGLIKTAGENEARFDHDPETLESLGLLIEESRTNQFQYSTDFSQGYWSKSSSSLTANTTTAPDGTTTASTLTVSTGSGFSYMLRGISTTNGTSYSLSYWVKYNNCQYVWLLGGEVPDVFAYFDLINGVVGAANGYDCSITPYPNGWYRITATKTKTGATATEEIAIGITRSATSPTDNQSGDAVYVWGAQFETGSFPTSYIPTSGSSVTRAVERALINQQIASGNITIVGEYKMRMTAGNEWNRLFGFGEGSSDIRPFINANGNITWYNYGTNAPVTDWSALGLSVPDNSYFRFAFAVRQNVSNSVSVNGTTVSTQFNPPPAAYVNWDELYLGWSDVGTNPRDITGHIKYFRVYNDAFTDAQLQLLTS